VSIRGGARRVLQMIGEIESLFLKGLADPELRNA